MQNLDRGYYIVFIQVEWVDPTLIQSFVFSSFSDQELNLEAADRNEFSPTLSVAGSLLEDDNTLLGAGEEPSSKLKQTSNFYVLELLMRSHALRSDHTRRTYYEK